MELMHIFLTKEAQETEQSYFKEDLSKPILVIAKLEKTFNINDTLYLIQRTAPKPDKSGASQAILASAMEEGQIIYSIMNRYPKEGFAASPMSTYWWIGKGQIEKEIRVIDNQSMTQLLHRDSF